MGQVAAEQYASPADQPVSSRRWIMLLLLCLAQFMAILDISVVNVALPVIGNSLDLGRETLTWVLTAYTVMFGGLLVLGGRLADMLGRRNVFLAGVSLFALASLTAGLAGSGGVLIGGRAVQGMGAALLSPAALSILTTEFTGKERNRALGIWAAISAGGAAVGFVVGGALTSGPGWQWAFFINLPVSALVLASVPMAVPARPRSAGKRVDVPGALTGTAAVALIIFGLIRAGDKGWGASSALIPIIAGVLLAAGFVIIERRTPTPLIPLALIRKPPLPGAVAVMGTATAILLGAYFITSVYLQRAERFSAIHTGLIFLPVAVATGLGAHFATAHMSKIGPRPLTMIGTVLSAIGLGLMGWFGIGGSVNTQLLPSFLLVGAGMGMTFVSAINSGLSAVDQDHAGVASGVLNTGHEIGASLGIAVVSTVAAASISQVASLVLGGYEHAYFAIAAGSLAVAVLAVLLLPRGVLDRGEAPLMFH